MSCAVPNCQFKQQIVKSSAKKSLFYAPKNNEQLFKKWQTVVQTQTGKLLELTSRICEDHFVEEDVLRFYETVLPDGTMDVMKKVRPDLRKEAIPSIFSDQPPQSCQLANEIQACVVPAACDSSDIATECMHTDQDIGEKQLSHQSDETTQNPVPTDIFTFEKLSNGIQNVTTPNTTWTGTFLPTVKEVIFVKWNPVNYSITKKLIVTESLSVKIILYDQLITIDSISSKLCNVDGLVEALCVLDKLHLCPGLQMKCQATRSELCQFYFELPEKGHPRSRCRNCQLKRKKQSDNLRRKVLDVWQKKHEKCKGVVRSIKQKNTRLKRKVLHLQAEMESAKQKCAAVCQDAIDSAIASLPKPQQEAVQACFTASRVKSSTGRRYTTSWVYECLLLRIKSRKLYEHLRTHDILALPCTDTLDKYIRRMNSCYGFQQATFDLLKKKAQLLKPEERRGTLLIDEMKLTEKLTFNRRTLTLNGFTDLGNHTPLHQQSKKGDHALVMLFQPLRGAWFQTLAAFLSRGCATSSVLYHLVMECIILLEKAGFHVDVVTADGATWNRSMWKLFGITETNISCEHVFDESRRLWFLSDFPHLIKNLRNAIVKYCTTWTPNGDVKLKHWDAVIAKDNPIGFNLKVCPKLSNLDVRPVGYQKMSVARAYRFFDRQTAVGMLLYQADHADLADCTPSVDLIKNVHNLIVAMSSRTPLDALRMNSDGMTHIKSFLEFLEKWEAGAREKGYTFISDSTCYGLKITLRATMELTEYLTSKFNYKYVMTARLNQDALERFFGMMRGACGSNDHPDSTVFAQLFRLVSTYSLVKPPKGSNVSGGEMLTSLLNTEDLTDSSERLSRFQTHLDTMIDNGATAQDIALVAAAALDHDYNVSRSSDFATSFISGYVARRSSRFTRCSECLASLKSNHSLPRDKMIDIASKGYLLRPSESLFQLVAMMEAAVLKVVSNGVLCSDTLFQIAQEIENENNISLVGCAEHKDELTESIIRFYLITRMHFLCNSANRIDNIKSEKSRKHRKSAKLM